MTCTFCSGTALYIVSRKGYCKAHRSRAQQAAQQRTTAIDVERTEYERDNQRARSQHSTAHPSVVVQRIRRKRRIARAKS